MTSRDELRAAALSGIDGRVEVLENDPHAVEKLNREIPLELAQLEMKRRRIAIEARRLGRRESRLRAERWALYDRTAEVAMAARDVQLADFIRQIDDPAAANSQSWFANRLEKAELAGAGAVLESLGIAKGTGESLARLLGRNGLSDLLSAVTPLRDARGKAVFVKHAPAVEGVFLLDPRTAELSFHACSNVDLPDGAITFLTEPIALERGSAWREVGEFIALKLMTLLELAQRGLISLFRDAGSAGVLRLSRLVVAAHERMACFCVPATRTHR